MGFLGTLRRVRIGVQGQGEDESVRWVRVRVMRFCQGVIHPSIREGRCEGDPSVRGDHPSINQVRPGQVR